MEANSNQKVTGLGIASHSAPNENTIVLGKEIVSPARMSFDSVTTLINVSANKSCENSDPRRAVCTLQRETD